MASYTDEYREYINSGKWRKRRNAILDQRGRKCERCGNYRYGRGEIHVHHLTYERLGKEKDSDLQVLCVPCHEIADQERAKEAEERSEYALHEARLNGWARKKYGEDWLLYHDSWEVEEEFNEWLEGREDY